MSSLRFGGDTLPMLAQASGKPVQGFHIWCMFVLQAGGFQDEDGYPEALHQFV